MLKYDATLDEKIYITNNIDFQKIIFLIKKAGTLEYSYLCTTHSSILFHHF
jgi:hypothetical protein